MRRANTKWATLAIGVIAVAGLSACAPKVASGPPACAAPAAPADAITLAVFNRVNGDRAALGLRGLAWNPQLYCLATDWSNRMAASGSLHHRDLNSVIRSPGYGAYRTLGENILRGANGITGDQMENVWMASPAHRANIVSPFYTSIGIGLAVSPDGTRVFATQNFGG
jgi:uncharacterized protein YkwD